ncbi:MAG: isopeptide-forming domain-containing fimbrial protein [Eubacteriales bacterium]|nr:isopeptide-forming domain-containing fimbrial protein [Eubacteriales bacterium]
MLYDDPDPAITKSAENLTDPGQPSQVNDVLKYTIVLNNRQAGSKWSSVNLTDVIPAGLTLDTASMKLTHTGSPEQTLDASAYNSATRTITAPLGDQLGAQEYTLTFEAKVNLDAMEADADIGNVARAAGNNPSGTQAAVQSLATYANAADTPANGGVLYDDPDPAITKSAENLTDPGQPSQVNDVLKYTIVVNNRQAGSKWSSVSITDVLPAGLTLDTASIKLTHAGSPEQTLDASAYSAATRTVTVPLGDQLGVQQYTLTFEAKVNLDAMEANADIGNIARAAGTGEKGEAIAVQTQATYANTADTPANGGVLYDDPDPAIAKSAENLTDPGQPSQVNDVLKYTIVLNNRQDGSKWSSVNLTDVIPVGLTLDTASMKLTHTGSPEQTLDASAYSDATRSITVPLGDQFGVQEYTLTFEAKVNLDAMEANADIGNVARAAGTGEKGEAVAVQSQAIYPNTADTPANDGVLYDDPDPAITKSAENLTDPGQPSQVNDVLKYTIVLNNRQAGSKWSDVNLTDVIPAGLTLDTASMKLTHTGSPEQTLDASVYSDATRTITVPLGDQLGVQEYTLTFEATVDIAAILAIDGPVDIGNIARAAGTGAKGEEVMAETEIVYANEEDTPANGGELYDDPDPTITKTAENLTDPGQPTQANDVLKYTIEVNNRQLHSIWHDVVLTDVLPKGLKLDPTTLVQILVDGTQIPLAATVYDEATNTITVNVADMADVSRFKMSFEVLVTPLAMEQDIGNMAAAEGTGASEEQVRVQTQAIYAHEKDELAGGKVLFDDPDPQILKTAVNITDPDMPTQVGDILGYTIRVSNRQSDSLWKNVTIRDAMPWGIAVKLDTLKLTAPDGTEQILDSSCYNPLTRTVTVSLGDVEGVKEYTLTFEALVTSSALGVEIDVGNIATVDGKTPQDKDLQLSTQRIYAHEDDTPENGGILKADRVKTGDRSNLALWLIVLAASAAAGVFLTMRIASGKKR